MIVARKKHSTGANILALIRSALIVPALFTLLRYAAGFWSQTELWLKPAATWISNHGWLTFFVGTAFLALVLRKKFVELLYWALTCIGPWVKLLGILSLLIGSLFAYRGFEYWATVGPIWCMVLQWCGLFLIISNESEIRSTKADFYHREHLVERLAELLLETPDNIRRIGILAEWGEGKTQVMKMLEEHLRDRTKNKFRMAWVNPWRANSHEEAWVEIARGVDQALGFPRLLPRSLLSIPGLGTLLELLPKPFGGFTADMKTLLTSQGSASDKVAVGLAQYLKRRDQWLLIFIDDMERVGSEELRKIFPVVDRLVELERCYFIFAIDPMRIAKAFKEDSEHKDETKGYLDKVLDFQMSLPMASKGEVLEMLQNKIDPSSCPKLASVLPELREYLPINPRLADRFLRDADGRERMFLSRFRPHEQSYEGFFLLLILEISYPRALQNLRANLADFDSIEFLARKGFYGSNAAEDKKHKDFLEKIVNGLASHEVAPANKLIDRLIYLSSHLLIFDEGQRALDFTWAFEGYRKLIRFSAQDRLAFLVIWRNRAGAESIASMLEKVDEYDEKDLVVRETLKMEMEGIGNRFSQAYRIHRNGDELTGLKIELDRRMMNFVNHASAIFEGRMLDLDQTIFNRDIFDSWLEIVGNKLMRGLPDEFVSDMIIIRRKLTISLAKLLPPIEYCRWAKRDVWSRIHFAEGSVKAEVEAEFLPVRDEILNELTAKFVSLLETKSLSDFFPPSWLEVSQIFDLKDPTIWLLNASNEHQLSLDAMVARASSNLVLRENLASLITDAILAIYEGSPDDVLLSHSEARPCIEKCPWLLRKCWKGAWSGPLPPKTKGNLLNLRKRAIDTEEGLVGRQDVSSTILDVLTELEVPEDSTDAVGEITTSR